MESASRRNEATAGEFGCASDRTLDHVEIRNPGVPGNRAPRVWLTLRQHTPSRFVGAGSVYAEPSHRTWPKKTHRLAARDLCVTIRKAERGLELPMLGFNPRCILCDSGGVLIEDKDIVPAHFFLIFFPGLIHERASGWVGNSCWLKPGVRIEEYDARRAEGNPFYQCQHVPLIVITIQKL